MQNYMNSIMKTERVKTNKEIDLLKMKDFLAYSHGKSVITFSFITIVLTVLCEINNIYFFFSLTEENTLWDIFAVLLMVFSIASIFGIIILIIMS